MGRYVQLRWKDEGIWKDILALTDDADADKALAHARGVHEVSKRRYQGNVPDVEFRVETHSD